MPPRARFQIPSVVSGPPLADVLDSQAPGYGQNDVFLTRLAARAAIKERGINHHETPSKNLRMSRGAGPDGPVHELLARRRQRMGLALRRHNPERLDQGR